LSFWKSTAVVAGLILPLAGGPALATGGVIEINQAKVMARGGFPFQITRSGSYRLTSNLTVADKNAAGIAITVSDVTIDLNGFSIIGSGTCATGADADGINAVGQQLITIYNGEVAGMGTHGVLVHKSGRIERMRILGNCGTGILCGDGCEILHNISNNNMGSGILIAGSGRVSSNVTQFNKVDGIELDCCEGTVPGVVVTNNTANNNGFIGIYLVNQGGAVIRGNAVSNNAYGLRCASGVGGYAKNVFSSNSNGNILLIGGSCVNLGGNLCDGSLCP
jgi:parallel beta-helix repeat protein